MTKIHSTASRQCYIDDRVYPVALLNEHHVRPRAFGGDDSPQNKKYLCPTCHQTLHRLAELMLAGKTGAARSLAGTVYQDPAKTKKILELASEAAKWERKFQTDTPDYAKEEAYKEVKIKLDGNTYRRLVTLSIEFGMRKRSVPSLVLRIVKGVLDSRYSKPAQEDDEDDFEGLDG